MRPVAGTVDVMHGDAYALRQFLSVAVSAAMPEQVRQSVMSLLYRIERAEDTVSDRFRAQSSKVA